MYIISDIIHRIFRRDTGNILNTPVGIHMAAGQGCTGEELQLRTYQLQVLQLRVQSPCPRTLLSNEKEQIIHMYCKKKYIYTYPKNIFFYLS